MIDRADLLCYVFSENGFHLLNIGGGRQHEKFSLRNLYF